MSDPHTTDDPPFGVKVVMCFLVADAIRRAVQLAQGWGAPLPAPTAVLILWITTDLLLAALLVMRTEAGRLWTAVLLLVHAVFIGNLVAVQDPYLWLKLDLAGRWRILTTLFVDALLFAYLLGPRARAWLAG